ncbi:MAG: hypothetical protein AB7G06_02440 [Bdellovibrionales bacterium]
MTTVNREVRELRQELKHLADVVQRSAKIANNNSYKASDAVQSLTGYDTDDLRRMANKAGKDVRRFLSEKANDAEELYHTAEKKVAEKPLQAMAAAIATGFVLSLLFRRN